MAAWADDFDPTLEDGFADEISTSFEGGADAAAAKDDKLAWENAKTVIETVTDSENKRYEIVKKVRTYHVDRPVTVVDIRAKWKRFGKSGDNNQDLVSRDPPIVLELGEIDPFERVARDEIVRLMNEVERMKIEVTDPRLARFAKIKEEQEKAALEETTQTDQPKERTWAAARGEKSSAQRKEDTDRRLRITNISDDITREELYNIFDTNEYKIEKIVYFPGIMQLELQVLPLLLLKITNRLSAALRRQRVWRDLKTRLCALCAPFRRLNRGDTEYCNRR
ncbi:hypothetical protein TCSYLVIO_003837 [Trypanosoma cruzi]|nr:hypothetical protein TCSYLVIO_003837 [Trypanosoma cruzi]